MKLVSYETGGERSFGIARQDGIVDLGKRLGGRFASLAALIAADGVEAARAHAKAAPDLALSQVRLLKPLDAFGKCFCVGVNYPARNDEYKDNSEQPKYPSLFVRYPESFTGPDMPLIRPRESEQLDYEGELVLVIGRRGRRIAPESWREHVMGYTIANEGSVRDWIRHGKFNVTPGKNWPGSGSLGPWIVTADAFDPQQARLTTRVNGELRQDDTIDRMIFPIGQILAYISTFCTLEPGDIVLTGTPVGSGARFDPPIYLRPGDVVEVEIEGLGTLRNSVADEPTDA